MTEDPRDLFSHDGHLTMLSLDRFDAGDLSVDLTDNTVEHLRDCSRCSARLEQIQHEPAFNTIPLRVHAARHSRTFGGLAVAASVAAAAALLLIVWPQPEQASPAPAPDGALTASPYTTTTAELDGMSAVTEDFELRVFAGLSDRRLTDHERVSFDDDIVLEVSPARTGYLTVLVVGEAAEEELVDGTGGIEPLDVRVLLPATEVSPKSGPTTVRYPAEPRRGGSPVEERLVVIQCDDLDSLETLEADPDPELAFGMEACAVRDFPLTRYRDYADS